MLAVTPAAGFLTRESPTSRMNVMEAFERMPFNDHLGIELLETGDGHVTGRLELESVHSSNPETLVAHGGATYALADTVG